MDTLEWLVVGLGNPGPEYAETRHNVGYLVLDVVAQRMGVRLTRHYRAVADSATGRLLGQRVTLVRPRTYMNSSGGPTKAAADYVGIPASQMVIVHDDLDIPFGELRLKSGGGDGGHNGLKSLRKSFDGDDFYRVRVGIGRPPGSMDAATFVLKHFSSAQRKELPVIVAEAADAVELLVTDGIAVAQNRYHCG